MLYIETLVWKANCLIKVYFLKQVNDFVVVV